ncbi:hypothetical protein CCR94_01155 [Rhodoblastus sphagnicola]|uniref:Uncharacterized protein n=1 Tax=Rhodoblastus sphagnicola TaxID=333368 RepID=A0A2S6NG77_9HYPH|nr:hypothetical protein CCR94_01155 [Rhodoblastus sphagnicola]
MGIEFNIANYRPPGPVAEAFIRSPHRAPFIMGHFPNDQVSVVRRRIWTLDAIFESRSLPESHQLTCAPPFPA